MMMEHERGDAVVDATAQLDDTGRRGGPADRAMQVRETDLEPYVGLGYLSKLFRFIAIFLMILLVAEIATGLVAQGRAAIPTLLAEASRLIVLAGLLWGAGDLALLLIDVGHDVRAARILLGRQVSHHMISHHAEGANAVVGGRMEERSAPLPREVELGSSRGGGYHREL